MRIACLQFAPQVGDVDNNLNRADAVLSRANPKDLDLLVLPELAFSGYNFRSLQHISPFLEPTAAGVTSLWARTTALRYNCVVTAGYPEKVDVRPKWPAGPEYYNSAIMVSADGETLANYRKSFLYYTDETWALEGTSGFFSGKIEGLGSVAMGICMDLNPYKFEAPWTAWEFAHHVLRVEANLVILSMAWLTREDISTFSRKPKDPDMETLAYWLSRLEPTIRAETEGEIIVVFANRCGTEDDVIYAGTSAVLGINEGEVIVYGILGRGDRELLVVDTSEPPQAKLVSEPNSAASAQPAESVEPEVLEDEDDTLQGVYDPVKDVAAAVEVVPEPIDNVPHTIEEESDYDSDQGSEASHQPEVHRKQGNLAESPIDPRFPQTNFGGANLSPEHSLRAIVSIMQTPSPDSPTFRRPPSPKSRHASRNGTHPETRLEIEDFYRTSEPRVSPVEKFEEILHSASTAPDNFESSFTKNPLGPRSRHISPRPTSTMW